MSPASMVDPMHRIQRVRDSSEGRMRKGGGGVDSWGRSDATLRRWNLATGADAAASVALADLVLAHRCEDDVTVVVAVARCARRVPVEAARLWGRWRRCHERVVLDRQLQMLGLREPPPAPPPPPPAPEIVTELRVAAEVYLQETASGVTDLYGRLAGRGLVPGGCDDPVRYLRNLLSRCRSQKWLITSDRGRASLPGPRLAEARRNGGWDAEWT